LLAVSIRHRHIVLEGSGRVRARALNGAGFWPRRLGKLAVPIKFCVVGAINALVDFGTLNLLSWSLPPADAVQLALYNTLALVLANANSYLFNTLWTFKEQARHEGPRQKATFVAQAVLNVGVNNGLFWLTAGLLADTALSVAVAQNVAKAISTVGASTLSFLLMRYVVFGSRRGTQRSVEGAHATSTGGEWKRTRYCLTRRPTEEMAKNHSVLHALCGAARIGLGGSGTAKLNSAEDAPKDPFGGLGNLSRTFDVPGKVV
jgi:putative flippase GtrA